MRSSFVQVELRRASSINFSFAIIAPRQSYQISDNCHDAMRPNREHVTGPNQTKVELSMCSNSAIKIIAIQLAGIFLPGKIL